jgi:hypothetical protein
MPSFARIRRLLRVACVGCVLACLLLPAWAADRLISVSTRSEVTTSYWWMPRDGAIATVLLFSGGTGASVTVMESLSLAIF